MKTFSFIMLSSIAFLAAPHLESGTYYAGKTVRGSYGLQLNADSSFCKAYWDNHDPCHLSGYFSGFWRSHLDTVILAYNHAPFIIGEDIVLVPNDTFLLHKKNLIQIGPPFNIDQQRIILKRKRAVHPLQCENRGF